MPVEPLFRVALTQGWDAAWNRYPEFTAALTETYGDEAFGPGGPAVLLSQMAPHILSRWQAISALDWEGWTQHLLEKSYRHLPGPIPTCYLGTLLGMAPAATLSVQGRPALAVGVERFGQMPAPQPPPRTLYHPDELAEMIPHEAAHATRFEALSLPPSPRFLTLADMLLLEGTALLFADWLLGQETIRTFLPAVDLARWEAAGPTVLAQIQPDLSRRGMPVFHRYFAASAPVSGYFLGWLLVRRYQSCTGADPVTVLLTPTDRILQVALP